MAEDVTMEGGFDCRAVRYRMTRPLFVHCCHCRWCQRESGSASAINAMIESERVAILAGEPEMVDTPSASGMGQRIARCTKAILAEGKPRAARVDAREEEIAMTLFRWAALLALASPAFAQEVSVAISPPMQEIRQGSAPRFEVVVRANQHVRMLDFGSRLDLRDRLVKPRFVQLEDLSDTPTHPHVLQSVADTDYVELEKGNSLAYETNGAPLDIGWLPPGDYVLQLRVYTDWAARFVESNKVRFRIVPAPDSAPRTVKPAT